MKKSLFALFLVGCTTMGSHAAASGIGYTQSVASSMAACDWSGHESNNETGCAFEESQIAAEDADCHEDYE